jgi:hypothetical protein
MCQPNWQLHAQGIGRGAKNDSFWSHLYTKNDHLPYQDRLGTNIQGKHSKKEAFLAGGDVHTVLYLPRLPLCGRPVRANAFFFVCRFISDQKNVWFTKTGSGQARNENW